MESMAEIEKNNEWVDKILEEGEIEEKENEKLLRCNVKDCHGKAFTRPFALVRHWAEIHEKEVTLFECAECMRVFRRATDVKRHSLQKHQREHQVNPINRQNKFYVAPGEVQPPAGYKKKPLPVLPKSQMAFVPKEAPVKEVRQPLVSLNQAKVQEEVMSTSRDILLKNFLKAEAKLKFWTTEREKAKTLLEKFDQEKRDALITDLKRQLKEERKQRKTFEDKSNLLGQQLKLSQQSEETVKDLKRKLTSERDLRRESEAKIRRMTEKSELSKRQDFIDYVDINFQ